MYDTLKLWLPSEVIKESSFIDRVPKLLNNSTLHTRPDAQSYVTGNILGMNVSVSNNGISLKGSICKSYLGNNFKTLTRQDTQRAIEQLADVTLLPVQEANLTKIDFANNFIVSCTPESYYYFLGDCQHFDRIIYQRSIAYLNSLRYKTFYNKIAEGKSKGEVIPAIWANKHVLRYELRYTSRLLKQFNTTQIQAKDLYKESFYIDMVSRWIKEYEAIKKNNLLTPKADNMTNKNANDYLLAVLIEMQGQNDVQEITSQWKGKFTNEREFYRFKAKLKTMKDLTQKSELIAELDKKINQVKEYCR
jgi:hypothetical protein